MGHMRRAPIRDAQTALARYVDHCLTGPWRIASHRMFGFHYSKQYKAWGCGERMVADARRGQGDCRGVGPQFLPEPKHD